MSGLDWGITWGLRDGVALSDLFSGSYLFIIIIGVMQFIFSLVAMIDIVKRRRFKCGNMAIWIIVVLFLQFIGPVLYFAIGREEY